jgi:hypothetical protein
VLDPQKLDSLGNQALFHAPSLRCRALLGKGRATSTTLMCSAHLVAQTS